ncbi:MAG: alkaline phosphatase family protein [Bacteroidia bacterium]|nr:alkaline phosphatase family protein [Bacteroidia bacterium]
MLRRLLPLCLIALSAACRTPEDSRWIPVAPAGDRYCEIRRDGETVLPNGRLLTPYGNTVMVAPHPYGLVLSPDGSVAVTANSGISPISVSIIRNLLAAQPQVQQIPEGAQTDAGVLASVFMGLAISPDNQTLYVAGGQENKIFLFDLATGAKTGAIDCAVRTDTSDFTHGYIGDLVLSQDGKRIYAVDQIGFRMLTADTETRQLTGNVRTGRYPFGIALSPDGRQVFVANVGMYEYRWIPSFDPKRPAETALQYPPFAYGSQASVEGIHTDSLDVPGLGDPNVPESFSVWTIDLERQTVVSKVKTGFKVGDLIEGIPAVGGSSPNSLVATDDYVFVSNGNNDCISVINRHLGRVERNIMLTPDPRLRSLRGAIPFGLALSPDQRRLYVALAGLNAVGVIDVQKQELQGLIPAGWFPSKLQVTPDGKHLIVANAKGYGSGPNGGSAFTPGPEGSGVGNLMKGSVSIMPIPDDMKLSELTGQAIRNNFRFLPSGDPAFAERGPGHPVPLYAARQMKTPIRHIIFVSKENRTYDEVFGQLPGGKGEAALARFGENASFSSRDGSRRVEAATVMPNHLALARQFALADNFYVDSDHSADGHRWLSATYPNEWVESSVSAAYGGARTMRDSSRAPGNLAFEGASGAIYPEDYNEAGSMWEHLDRNGISFWNFGCGIMFAPHLSDNAAFKHGYAYAVNYPVPAPLFRNSSRIFPTYNMAIPDQFRVDKFIEEFEAKWIQGPDTMPQVLTVILGNDHGAGERPEAGYPFRESYMADNDLALGRLVEYISRTKYWASTMIVVTEDDAQGGVDHVDAHRSILMVISPWAKRGYTGHAHYSFGSIFKTFWHVLGLPYLNQYDAGASDLGDLFAPVPDFTPYTALPSDLRIFDPARAPGPEDPRFDRAALTEGPPLDDEEFLESEREE